VRGLVFICPRRVHNEKLGANSEKKIFTNMCSIMHNLTPRLKAVRSAISNKVFYPT